MGVEISRVNLVASCDVPVKKPFWASIIAVMGYS
jgi:hypothetical protein